MNGSSSTMRVNQQANVTPTFRVLSDDQIESIYHSALHVLQHVGARIHDAEAIEIYRRGGAVVEDGNLVKIPAPMVKQALSTTPETVTLAGRDRTKRLFLERNRIYYGTGSDCPFVIDPYTDERRPFTFADVYNAAKVAEALPNIDFFMSLGLTSDVPVATYDRHQFLAMVKGTTKPMVITSVDEVGLLDQYEMACAIVGGADEFRQAPLFAIYIEPSSPLISNAEATRKVLVAAEKGIPAIYTPCPMCGATAPTTMAGLLVQTLAESLCGIVLGQLVKPGAQFIIGGVVSIMDMNAMILAYGAPEFHLMSAALTDIAKWLRLPMFSTAGCSDAKVLDEQAAIEAAISIATAGLSGANLIHDVGYLESALVGSYDMLVLSDEIIAMAKHFLRGIVVNDETLALAVIEGVGPGGNFLGEEHTLRHFRGEFWFPRLLDRNNLSNWTAMGARTLEQRVRQRVLSIIESFEPEPLAADVEDQLRRLVAKADRAPAAVG
ncbi:MAG: trimethylamine methyltransferase family protein [Anaerolineae bacterium]